MPELEYSKAFGSIGVAFSSGRSVDFHKGDPDHPDRFVLTAAQKEWLRACGLRYPEGVIFPKQVHGDNIWRVGAKEAGMRGRCEADAIVTAEPGVPIAVRTADCLPLLVLAPGKKVAAAIHAGWKSSKLGIAAKTLAVMRDDYGVRISEVRVALGPCIRRDSYRVGPEFREHFPHDVITCSGGLFLDLVAVNVRQLLEHGVRIENIHDCGLCTFSAEDRFFSFRREGESAGRMINLIMLEK